MSTAPHAIHRPQAGSTGTPAQAGSPSRLRRAVAKVPPELGVLLLVAGLLNLWGLGINGNANEYYSATVHSMTQSRHNFIFGSFDSAGLQTVDKPPLALWVQAASARIFGFSSWSFLVPQALMGIAATALTYDFTRRRFGRPAGFIAGLVLALTPTAVAVFRHNNPDALLMLCSTVAIWALVKALEDSRTRWLVVSGVAVGLGFETKMATALLVAPAIVAAWLWIRPDGLRRALGQVTAFGASAAAVGLAWPVVVWLTPAADRPWISGTSDNSIWSLILGYNGLGRVLGQSGGPGGGAGGGGGGGNTMFGGDAGPLRLLNEALGSQGGWLIGLAVVGGLIVLVSTRLRRTDANSAWLIAVGGSFVTTAVAFSFASGIFHPYYVSALAPFTAALAGAGLGTALKGGRGLRVLGAVALVAGAAIEWVVLSDATQLQWLRPVLVGGTLGAGVALVLAGNQRVRLAAVAAGLALLLAAPAVWSAQTLGHATSGTFPTGGPSSAQGMGGPGGGGPGGMGRGNGGPPSGGMSGTPPTRPTGQAGGFTPPTGATTGSSATTAPGAAPTGDGMGGGMGGTSVTTEALAYTTANGGGTIVVSGQQGAAPSILSSNADVAGIGGFSGSESEVSVSWFADRVAEGRIRWVMTGSGGGMRDGRTGATTVMSAVTATCKAVSSVSGLYDCQGQATALRAAAK